MQTNILYVQILIDYLILLFSKDHLGTILSLHLFWHIDYDVPIAERWCAGWFVLNWYWLIRFVFFSSNDLLFKQSMLDITWKMAKSLVKWHWNMRTYHLRFNTIYFWLLSVLQGRYCMQNISSMISSSVRFFVFSIVNLKWSVRARIRTLKIAHQVHEFASVF